ncbi:MAG TPA: hypothetical protein VGW75_09575 [Solirubrobacteraceae bacterium]|jgi:hypothetical protein|nr:hypothetical protein [Solirubrobacteraceae bacterium]
MIRLLHSTTKSTGRAVAVLLAVLAVAAGGGWAVYAAVVKSDFAVSASPSTQTVAQGKSGSYPIAIERQGGFAGSVALTASGLPAGASATFSPNPVAGSASTLVVTTSKTTPAGSYGITVTGTSGKLVRSAKVTLTVQQPQQSGFTLAVTPAVRTVAQGDDATYDVAISRSGNLVGVAIPLTVSGLPAGTTARFEPASPTGSSSRLTVTTTRSTPTGDASLTIAGSASGVSRTAAAMLTVQQSFDFQIAGSASRPLVPGRRVPLDLTLTNRNAFPIAVKALGGEVLDSTSVRGCSGTRNYVLRAYGGTGFTLPPGTAKLSALGVPQAQWPAVEMRALNVSQDGCKGAGITLKFTGSATK